ncbi:hypothetical protein X777_12625 [Ooceraea biroi]|uniref:Uncharacterized protein n=1 Tax=Ooceraea biroi TaxID=2015173 RepID=A0A026W2A7_OOCBI|nr:hypothetical protein X777_12625 [Ooceraea biroi]
MCGYVPSYTHHANATASTPRHATPRHATSARAAAISWKPGRCLGTPDPLNKTPLHVPARLASHDGIGNLGDCESDADFSSLLGFAPYHAARADNALSAIPTRLGEHLIKGLISASAVSAR